MVWKIVDTRFFDYTNDENPDTVFSEKKLLALVERIQDGDPTITPFEWHRLVDTIQGIIDDPRRRLQRLKVLRDVQMEASLADRKTF